MVPPGTVLGPLLPEVSAETGLKEVQVIASCSHDTGEAVAAVPAQGDDWAYLSSGTWSLIGVELPRPLISEEIRGHNFTNECGYGGTTRFLKNIVGLWILQESRRSWAKQGRELDYAALTEEAKKAEPFRSIINPNAARFAKPGDMPGEIVAYCRETKQAAPETPGQVSRCVLESLALSYRAALDEIQELTGRMIREIAYRWRRQSERAFESIRSKCHQARSRRRSCGSNRSRKCAHSGYRHGAGRVRPGTAGDCARFLPLAHL